MSADQKVSFKACSRVKYQLNYCNWLTTSLCGLGSELFYHVDWKGTAGFLSYLLIDPLYVSMFTLWLKEQTNIRWLAVSLRHITPKKNSQMSHMRCSKASMKEGSWQNNKKIKQHKNQFISNTCTEAVIITT